jgi:hypothetical protein
VKNTDIQEPEESGYGGGGQRQNDEAEEGSNPKKGSYSCAEEGQEVWYNGI